MDFQSIGPTDWFSGNRKSALYPYLVIVIRHRFKRKKSHLYLFLSKNLRKGLCVTDDFD